MPFIIKNGKYYGSSADGSVDITEEEYNNLLASGQVNPNITYYITDGELSEEGSFSGIIEVTQQEYDALSNEEKNNGAIYAITDSEDLAAKNMAYDGSVTGLGNNVQDAIDNVNDKINEQSKNIADLGESVSNGKTLVANAITAQGVSTSTSATFADMASNISKISSGFIGTLKATSSGLTSNTWYSTATVDVKSVYPDYQKITIDNICVQIPLFTTINGATLSLSYTYDPSTGIITIKSTGGGNNALWLPSSTSSFNVKVAIV